MQHKHHPPAHYRRIARREAERYRAQEIRRAAFRAGSSCTAKVKTQAETRAALARAGVAQ